VPLSEATVRVTLEVTRFEENLRAATTQAAQRAGKDADKELSSSFSAAGKNAATSFSKEIQPGIQKAAKDAISDFRAEFAKGGTAAATDAGKAIRTATADASGKAGRDSGSAFSKNFNASFLANNPLLATGVALGAAFSQQLVPALGILGAMPSLLLGVGAAAAVTVVAVKGIGDGIKAVNAGDIDKLETTLSKLSPQAQAFVRNFAAVHPQLVQLKSDIQDAFFGQLQNQFTALSAALNGNMRTSILGLSTSVGLLARGLATAFLAPQGANDLSATLRNTKGFVDQLTPGISRVSAGFLDFAAATAPALRLIGNAIGTVLTQFGAFLTANAQSGRALEWVSGGVVGFGNLVHSLIDLGRALLTLVNAAQPVTILFGGLLPIVERVVSLFGQLPAPLQSAALAMAVLSATGLPAFLKQAQQATGPVSVAVADMGRAYARTATAVRDFGVATSATSAITGALGRAVDNISTTVSLFGDAVRTNLVNGFTAMDQAVDSASTTLQTGFVASALQAEQAATTTGSVLGTALTRASLEAEAALSKVAAASAEVRATWQEGLVPTGLLINQTMERAAASVTTFASGLAGRLEPVLNSAAAGLARFQQAVETGFVRSAAAAQTAAQTLSTAIQTGLIRASLAANDALTAVGTRLTSGVLKPLVDATSAYRSTSTAVREFATQSQFLSASISQTPTVLDRVRSGFTNLTASAAGSAAAFGSVFSGPLAAVGRGLDGLVASAAGAGRALASGVGSAISGLVSALGGPWGVAIAGASAALAILSSSQEEAAKAAADHKAQVASLADTLDKQTGAVTDATLAMIAETAAKDGSIQAARNLGISTSALVNALGNQGEATVGVRQQLAASIKTTIASSDAWKTHAVTAQEAGISLDLLASALSGNTDSLAQFYKLNIANGGSFNDLLASSDLLTGDQKKLVGALNNTNSSLKDAQDNLKAAAAAYTPAQVQAQHYTDALGILRDTTRDADAKARALADALNILAGGTVPAEVAQAKFTDQIKQLNDGLANSVKGLTGTGNALLTTTGRIDASSQAGAFLVDTYDSLSTSLSTAAAATVDAGQKQGNLDGALKQVKAQAQTARDQFIKTAQSLGLNADQAKALADRYGLIPELITTQFSTPGLSAAQQEVVNLKARIDSVPPGKSVTLTTLSAEAEAALVAFGAHVTHLPDGRITVQASTAQAQAAVDGFIRANDGRHVTITIVGESTQITVGSSTKAVTGALGGIVEHYAAGGIQLTPMSGSLARIVAPNTWRVVGDRTTDDEAFIPINSSGRSRALLSETARRMGFAVMANGGLLGGKDGGSSVSVAPGAIVIQAPFSDPELVAKATLNELARQVAS
jgi:hypothetical protein